MKRVINNLYNNQPTFQKTRIHPKTNECGFQFTGEKIIESVSGYNNKVKIRTASPSMLKLTGAALLLLIPFIYCVIALNTGDWMWASPIFRAQPDMITIHCFGNDVIFQPGATQFDELVSLINKTLTGPKNWGDLSISLVTYQDYRIHPNMMTLEVKYPGPLRVHSPYKFFSDIDILVIPLEGRHAQTNIVFGLKQGEPATGSFRIESIAPLVEEITSQRLCREP